MLQRVFFLGLFFGIQYASAAATWKTPTSGDDLKANTQDSVWLDWSSTFAAPLLRMWCNDKADGGNTVLVSSFKVDTNGPFEYIMDSFLEPNTMEYPLTCRAQLVENDKGDNEVDCPVGIVWSYNAALPMKTVSQTEAAPPMTTQSDTQPTLTPDQTRSASTTTDQTESAVTTGATKPLTSPLTSSLSNTEQSVINPTPSAKQSSTPSAAGSESDSRPKAAGGTSTSSSENNTGAIVGGVIGGIAVLSFIIFGFIFMRRQQRNSASPSIAYTEPASSNFFFFKKWGADADTVTMPVYEKEGSGMARELEANVVRKPNHTAAVGMLTGTNHYP